MNKHANNCLVTSSEPLPTLHRYIGKTLRVNARHLPWAIAQKIRADQEIGEGLGAFSEAGGQMLIFELEAYSWRADVTRHNIAAAEALGWNELHQMLLIAQQHGCEALELSGDNLALPDVFGLPLLDWP